MLQTTALIHPPARVAHRSASGTCANTASSSSGGRQPICAVLEDGRARPERAARRRGAIALVAPAKFELRRLAAQLLAITSEERRGRVEQVTGTLQAGLCDGSGGAAAQRPAARPSQPATGLWHWSLDGLDDC